MQEAVCLLLTKVRLKAIHPDLPLFKNRVQKSIPIIDRDAFKFKLYCILFDILAAIRIFVPLTTIDLILNTTGLVLDLATDFDLERFITLQHID